MNEHLLYHRLVTCALTVVKGPFARADHSYLDRSPTAHLLPVGDLTRIFHSDPAKVSTVVGVHYELLKHTRPHPARSDFTPFVGEVFVAHAVAPHGH